MEVVRLFRRSRGNRLFEMVVVTLLMGFLSFWALRTFTGSNEDFRGVANTADVSTVQSAVESYTGAHPQGRYPTLNGCLAGQVLSTVTSQCASSTAGLNRNKINENNLAFVFPESLSGEDLNGDGDLEDSFQVAPIIWDKAFVTRLPFSQTTTEKRFLGDFLEDLPGDAYEFFFENDSGEHSWKDSQNFDPDNLGNIEGDPKRITAPSGIGPGDTSIDVDTGQFPVWVIGEFQQGIQVKNLLLQGTASNPP